MREEIFEEVKLNFWKWFRFDEVEGENGICDVLYDLDVLCSDIIIKCFYVLFFFVVLYELMVVIFFDGKGIDVVSLVDFVFFLD